MAGMFYSLQEVAEKLGKTPEEIQDLVKSGKLREFRDGQTQLFKVQEVDSLLEDSGSVDHEVKDTSEEQPLIELEDDELLLSDEPQEEMSLEEEPLQFGDEEPHEPQEISESENTEFELELMDDSEKEPDAEEPKEAEDDEFFLDLQDEDSSSSQADTAKLDASATDELFLDDTSSLEEDKDETSSATDELILADSAAEKSSDESDEFVFDETSVGDDDKKEDGETDMAGQTETDYLLADDTLTPTDEDAAATAGETFMMDEEDESLGTSADEPSLEDIEGDVNLDSFGSGSGLLDLSLQADDTSLGGILDEIYTPEGEEGQDAPEEADLAIGSGAASAIGGSELGLEEDKAVSGAVPAGRAVYVEPEADAVSNSLGIMLFAPIIAVVYASIVLLSSFSGADLTILNPLRSLPMPTVILMTVLAVVALALFGVTYMVNAPAAPKTKKPKKAKPKAKKEKKPKKEKKAKAKKKK